MRIEPPLGPRAYEARSYCLNRTGFAAGSTGVEIELDEDLAALLRLATGLEAVTGAPKAAHCVEAHLWCSAP